MYRPAHRVESRGRLAGEMRWRLAALLALVGMTTVPAISSGMAPAHSAQVKVTVTPHSGSARTHFVVSFRAPVTTGVSFHGVYRVNAARGAHPGCQSATSVVAPPAKAGSNVRVVLAPRGSRRWCAGTFGGRVFHVFSQPCPTGKACPALVPRPQLIGKFTFRVARG